MFHLSLVLLSIMAAVWPSPAPTVSERWHAWPVARVFPDSVPGSSPSGARVTYVLAGVAPEAPCRRAFQPAAVRSSCRTALRATYADSTRTFVVTVGIAVLANRTTTATDPGAEQTAGSTTDPGAGQDGRPAADPDAGQDGRSAAAPGAGQAVGSSADLGFGLAAGPSADLAAGSWAGTSAGVVAGSVAGLEVVLADAGRPATVRPVAFPGGAAERFGDRQYFTGVVVDSDERYVVATAAGYADGRTYRPGDGAVARLRQAARQLATVLHQALTR
ncbi:hypothetical protein ACIBI7_49450 [Nonomuraea fuscirosea]|uniref:hypothetical protein n=1 Tax=Nonomuraea fuscirosea TaxID=1291556 RepID=UPI0037B90BFF